MNRNTLRLAFQFILAVALCATCMAQRGDAELLLRNRNCLACHRADSDEVNQRLRPLGAPDLSKVGQRVSPSWLRAFLSNPQAAKPGTTMPHVIGALHPSDQIGVVDDLVHYLVSRGGPLPLAVVTASDPDIAHGQHLYETVGCIPCHGPSFDSSGLLKKTTVEQLSKFLHDPLSMRPSGRMPSLALSGSEARKLALFLMQAQFQEGASNIVEAVVPGLSYEYFEGKFGNAGRDLENATASRWGHTATTTLPTPHRNDNFGFRLRGQLQVKETGEHHFFLTSDDGSRLWIDGNLIIDNDGIHAPQMKRAKIILSAGPHDIQATMFEAQGGESFNLGWAGPGFKKRTLGGSDVLCKSSTVAPIGYEPLTPKPSKVAQGRALFLKLRCINCHGDPEMKPIRHATRFEDLEESPTDCIGDDPGITQPNYQLPTADRTKLREALAHKNRYQRPRESNDEIAHSMALFQCFACHERDGVGGVSDDINECFQCDAELGDEGRIPPSLSKAGNKLRQTWLERVLQEGRSVRPYMMTRMPIFGENAVDGLPAHFAHADAVSGDDVPPSFTAEAAAAGRKLVGSTGFTCVVCHMVAGQPGTGVPAIDLATCNERLRPGWFRRALLQPDQVNPGTRMPAFWDEKAAGFPELLGGDAARQADAIWSYLSLGDRLPLPKGIGAKEGSFDLIPVDRPIGFGVFMKGVGPKTVAIGFPERVHLAFNKGAPGLARVWRGAFMNAKGTWHGRAGQLALPAGTGVFQLPRADVAARLPSPQAPWPTRQSLQYVARHTDRSAAQGFSMSGDRFTVKEEYIPRILDHETVLLRRITIQQSPGNRDGIYCLLARDAAINPTPDGFLVNSAWRCRVQGAAPFVVKTPSGCELRVRMPRAVDGDRVIEVEMGWPFNK